MTNLELNPRLHYIAYSRHGIHLTGILARNLTISFLPEYVGIPLESCAIKMIGIIPKALVPNARMESDSEALCKTCGLTIMIPNTTPCSLTTAP